MVFYLVDTSALPYPHAMGGRPHPDGTASNCPLALSTVMRTRHTPPGQIGYQTLFQDPAITTRRAVCDVHEGDWGVVLPAVIAFLEPLPASAEPASIDALRRVDARIASLATPDRRLALALLNPRDPIKYVPDADGGLRSNGQHRICWARTAQVTRVPVWFDITTATPPANAVLLQRG